MWGIMTRSLASANALHQLCLEPLDSDRGAVHGGLVNRLVRGLEFTQEGDYSGESLFGAKSRQALTCRSIDVEPLPSSSLRC
jgi:hypothetical protein